MFSIKIYTTSSYEKLGRESFFLTTTNIYKCFLGIPYQLVSSMTDRGE